MKVGEIKTLTLRLEPDGDADEEGNAVDCSYYVPETEEDEKHECVDCKEVRGEYMNAVPSELIKDGWMEYPYPDKFSVQTKVFQINGELFCLCEEHIHFRMLEDNSKYTPDKLGYKEDEMITKGDWIQAEWLEPQEAGLSGSALKFAAEGKRVSGIVRHIRGDHPSNPTSIRLFVEPDGGGEQVLVAPSWVKAHKKAPKENS